MVYHCDARPFLRLLTLCTLAGLLLSACGGATPSGAASPSVEPGPASQSAAESPGPTATPAASATRKPSATPTARNKAEPTLGYYGNLTPPPGATLATPNPTPVARLKLDKDIVNVLLIGSDYRASIKGFRTDTLIVVSINKKSGLVTMLSIPRDLYVWVPTFGMNRINVAFDQGERYQYSGGGPGLLVQTMLYNLGVPIHFYATVDFDGFRQIVNTVGGVDVPVTCQLTEYKLKDWSLDESDPANYELTTIPAGLTHMDGDLALFYARARPVGGDFFRSYRQRQVLRALYHTALSANILPQVPALYGDFQDIVATDMSLGDLMQFIPLALKLEDARLRSFTIGPNQTTGWRTPKGEEVLLPRAGAIEALMKDVFDPAAAVGGETATPIEVWNLSSLPNMDRLALDTLGNAGFAVSFGTPDGTPYPATTVVDFTDGTDEVTRRQLANLLHVDGGAYVSRPDANSPVPYRLIIADDYNPCPRVDWMDPLIVGTATPAPTWTPTPTATETSTPEPAPPTETPTP
jgi:LCP family protein required for cell wall assembly